MLSTVRSPKTSSCCAGCWKREGYLTADGVSSGCCEARAASVTAKALLAVVGRAVARPNNGQRQNEQRGHQDKQIDGADDRGLMADRLAERRHRFAPRLCRVDGAGEEVSRPATRDAVCRGGEASGHQLR